MRVQRHLRPDRRGGVGATRADGGRLGGPVELEALDVRTGSTIPAAAPAAGPTTSSTARWSLSVALLVLTALGAYVQVQRRGVEVVVDSWAMMREERHNVEMVTRDLYLAEQIARLSGEEDRADIAHARHATALESAARFREIRAALHRARLTDTGARRVRDRLATSLDHWIAEIRDFDTGSRISLDHQSPSRYDTQLKALRERWRVSPAPAEVPDLPGVATVQRMRTPVDSPIPATITAISAGGDRYDANLATGRVTVTKLAVPALPFLNGPAFGLRTSGDGRLLVSFGAGVAALPLKPGSSIEPLGPLFRVASGPARTWAVDGTGSGTAFVVGSDSTSYTIPATWSLDAATDDSLVISQYVDDQPGGLALVDLETRHQSMLDRGGAVLGVGIRTIVWTRDFRTIRVRSRDGAVADVALPEGWDPLNGAQVGDDGTVAVPLGRWDAVQAQQRAAVGLIRPGAPTIEVLGEATGQSPDLSWSGEWLFWTISTPFGPTGGIRAYHPATGTLVPVRLPQTVRTFVAHR